MGLSKVPQCNEVVETSHCSTDLVEKQLGKGLAGAEHPGRNRGLLASAQGRSAQRCTKVLTPEISSTRNIVRSSSSSIRSSLYNHWLQGSETRSTYFLAELLLVFNNFSGRA